MKINNKNLLRILSLCIIGLFFIAFGYASTDDQRIDIVFNGQTMSADLENVTLRQILEKIKSEMGMWFTGSDPVLEERVFVQFKDSPMQEALQRILFDINHVLFFDNSEKLVGVMILDKGDAGSFISLPDISSAGTGPPSQTREENMSSNDPFEAFSSGSPNFLPLAEAFKRARTQIVGEDALEGLQPLDNPFAELSDNPFAHKVAPDSENGPDDENSQAFPFRPGATLGGENSTGSTSTMTTKNPFDKEAPSPTGNPFEQKIE